MILTLFVSKKVKTFAKITNTINQYINIIIPSFFLYVKLNFISYIYINIRKTENQVKNSYFLIFFRKLLDFIYGLLYNLYIDKKRLEKIL